MTENALCLESRRARFAIRRVSSTFVLSHTGEKNILYTSKKDVADKLYIHEQLGVVEQNVFSENVVSSSAKSSRERILLKPEEKYSNTKKKGVIFCNLTSRAKSLAESFLLSKKRSNIRIFFPGQVL